MFRAAGAWIRQADRTATQVPAPVRRSLPDATENTGPVLASISDPMTPSPLRSAALVTAPPAVPPGTAFVRLPGLPVSPTRAIEQAATRWTASAWVLARGGSAPSAPRQGLLGGSQAGARLSWRANDDTARPLSLTARLSSPLKRRGAEAALGVEWQPVRGLPVRLLAERRQRVAGEGRSAFALLAHGGVSDLAVGGELSLDAYAQAGVVGARNPDLFADGGATIAVPLGDAGLAGRVAVGAGIWGSAQPGLARLDFGPRVSTTIAAGGAPARVSLDWRFRVAGAAAPSSGPALTVATGF